MARCLRRSSAAPLSATPPPPRHPPATVSAAIPSVRVSNSRPAMHIAEGTGRANTSTLARQSRAGSSASSEPPGAKVIIQVPVDSSAKGTGRLRMCGRSAALLSWMPATTRQSDLSPVARATSGSTVPTVSHGLTAGGISAAHPSLSARRENVAARGFQRSVCAPNEVTSETLRPLSRITQYCGYGKSASARANSSGKLRLSHQS